jgi:hypothetical protein
MSGKVDASIQRLALLANLATTLPICQSRQVGLHPGVCVKQNRGMNEHSKCLERQNQTNSEANLCGRAHILKNPQ